MSTIPASEIVSVTPGVLSTGGNALDLVAIILTTNIRIPIGTVASFINASSGAAYFGGASAEAAAMTVYFKGYTGATKQPGNVLMAQYPLNAVAAYLQGGNISAMTLAVLQAITGSLTVIMDGNTLTGSSINLSSATSFSSAAALIQTGLNSALPNTSAITASSAGKVLTVTAKASGTVAAGQTLVGTGITAGTIITGQLTGTTGGIGTYSTSKNTTQSSESMTTTATAVVVTYDSVSGAFIVTSGVTGSYSTVTFATGTIADDLLLRAADGAVLSQGADPATPAAFMNSIVAQTQDWASFMLMFDPDQGSGNTQKLAFATWNAGQNNRWAFVCHDADTTPTTTVPATTSLGYLLSTTVPPSSGTALIYEPTNLNLAAFICGAIASIDFDQPNGRITFAARAQIGLTASATSKSVSESLIANGYNFYGAYATANQPFVFFQNGQVSGPFLWLDTYVNQIWMNNAFQLALMEFIAGSNSIPFNAAGYAAIQTALLPKINDALNFGAIRAGVTLSTDQIAALNSSAGVQIANTIVSRGWYLQIQDANATVRLARGPLQITFWYQDGESVQSIDLSSIVVQ